MLLVWARHFSVAMQTRSPAATLRQSSSRSVVSVVMLTLKIVADCAPGTCYEGACAGDSVYTTDGRWDRDHGYKMCAGVWGDCCNAEGRCGTGPDFCAYGQCQLENCIIPKVTPGPPSWMNGNTTDGTCCGINSFTCNVVYGNCCNKDGMCSGLPSDCGVGW